MQNQHPVSTPSSFVQKDQWLQWTSTVKGWMAHPRQAPSCQPKDWFAPSLSRTLKESCILAVKQLWQRAAHTLKAAVLWWCWSRLRNVQPRDSFLLRPSQHWKNRSENYHQWKSLLWRRSPSLFPNKNVSSALSNGGRSWCLPWCTAWVLRALRSRTAEGEAFAPGRNGTHKDISIFSISDWLLQAGSGSAWQWLFTCRDNHLRVLCLLWNLF